MIEIFRNTPAGRQIADLVGSDARLSEITCYELAKGHAEKEAALSAFESLPFDANCRKHSVQLFLKSRKAGKTVADIDILIAGTAKAYGLTVITMDHDFSRLDVPVKLFFPTS